MLKKIGNLKTYPSSEIEESRVSIGFECVDRDLIKPEKCYDLLGKSGIKYARCQTGWAKTEKSKGKYDFAWLDDMVDNLLSRGIRPWLSIGYGNPLYMPDVPNPTAVGCVPLYYGEEATEAWKQFARAVAERYRGRVTHYEIWNEPNITHFWYPEKPDAKAYAMLVSMTGEIIRSENPDARIGSVISSIKFPYIEKMLEYLHPGDIDFHCFHSYRVRAEENTAEEVRLMRKMFDGRGFSEVEFWMGEGGRASHFPENYWLPGQSSEHQQAVWQLRRFLCDLECKVTKTSYFQVADMMERPYQMAKEVRKEPARQGILNGLTYTPKKSYETISRLATVLSGEILPSDAFFIGYIAGNTLESLSKKLICALRNGSPLFFYWLPSEIEEERGICGKIDLYLDGNGISMPMLVDLFTGEAYSVCAEETGAGLIAIKDLPIAEYPMMLCDRSAFEIDLKD